MNLLFITKLNYFWIYYNTLNIIRYIIININLILNIILYNNSIILYFILLFNYNINNNIKLLYIVYNYLLNSMFMRIS